MAESTQRTVSDGTLVSLGLSIDFIKQADISVFYDGTPAGVGTWSWVGPLTIGFTPAIPNGVEVLLRRSTERGKVVNVFTDGATFNNDSMDTNFEQTLFLTQEALEGAALTDAFADVDFHGFRPTNLGTAVNPGDAVSLAQYQADTLSAYSHALAAAASAAAAAASAAAAAAFAASLDPDSYATAVQGAKADTALQPAAIGVTVQGYDVAIAKTNVQQAWTSRQRGAPYALTDAANIAIDLGLSNNFTVTLAGNRTLTAPTSAMAGTSGVVAISQDATGSRTLAFDPVWDFPAGSDTAISSGATEVTLLAYYVISPAKIRVGLSKD